MARPRKPTKVLEFTGAFKRNPGRYADRRFEPQPRAGLGAPPKYFDAADRQCWDDLKKAVPKGVHTSMDRPTAELIARLLARFRRSDLKAAEIRVLASLMSRHGMTPADRSRVAIARSPARKGRAQGYLTA